MQAPTDPTPPCAAYCAHAPYRSPVFAASEAPAPPSHPHPSRAHRAVLAATLVFSVAATVTAVATHTAVLTASRCQSLVAASLMRARASHPRPETTLGDAVDELARHGRTPLYVSPAVTASALRGTVPLAAGAGNSDDATRALDAWSADRGLWLHVVDGVLRLEPAAPSVDLRCDDTLEACASRLERVASVSVVRGPTTWSRPVHLDARRGEPALEAMRAAAVSAGYQVDVAGRTLYVSGAPSPEPPRDDAAPWSIRGLGVGRYVLTSADVSRLLDDPARLMRSARILPETRAGRTVGVRVFGIGPDSVLNALGIQNGDVLTRMNGVDITDPDRCLAAYARLRRSDRVALELFRGGRRVTLEYIVMPT